MMILNLGAGHRTESGAINHDIKRFHDGIDVAHDLNMYPWPWADEQFNHIIARDVFEHLERNLIETCDEAWRITAPGGTMRIKYPLYTSPRIHHDPTHRWFWALESVDYLDPRTDYGGRYTYTHRRWHIITKTLTAGGNSVFVDLKKVGS